MDKAGNMIPMTKKSKETEKGPTSMEDGEEPLGAGQTYVGMKRLANEIESDVDAEMQRELWPAFKRFRNAIIEYKEARNNLRYWTRPLPMRISIDDFRSDCDEESSRDGSDE